MIDGITFQEEAPAFESATIGWHCKIYSGG